MDYANPAIESANRCNSGEVREPGRTRLPDQIGHDASGSLSRRLSRTFVVIGLIWLPVLIVAGCTSSYTTGHEAAAFSVDLLKIPDGRYRGDHQAKGIDYEVEVSVAAHRITEIKILKGLQRVFKKRCALCEVNDLIWGIIELQSIDVDAMSGATQTSIAVLHAITDALTPPFSHH